MSVRLFYTNLIDASGVAFSETSEQTNLPSSNVADEQISKVWRTGTSVAAEYVTVDLGSAQSATSAIIHNHTLSASDSSILVRGSTDNFAASNVLVGTFTYSTGTMTVTFGSASYRYWRILFTKASAGVTRDIGRIFIGTYTDIQEPSYDGYEEGKPDRDVTITTAGGQTYCDSRTNGRSLKLMWDSATQTTKEAITTLRTAVTTCNTFFVQVDSAGPTDIAVPWYVKLTKNPTCKVVACDSVTSYYWDVALDCQEQV